MINFTDLITEWTDEEKTILNDRGFVHVKHWPGDNEFADFYEKKETERRSWIIDKQGGEYFISEHIKGKSLDFNKVKNLEKALIIVD